MKLSRFLPALCLLSLAAAPAHAQSLALRTQVYEADDGTIVAADETGTYLFRTWQDYLQSSFFRDNGKRCDVQTPSLAGGGNTSDCTDSLTNPAAQYDPSVASYSIPVVVHILMHPNGSGAISDALVNSQIDILNEDFLALAGSNGAPGTNVEIDFFLATTDPNGNPTTGITRHTNRQWYNDRQNYAASIGWDTNRYLNIYTNTAGGNLGYAYVPNGGGVVGSSFDGVRILWTAFGRNAPTGPPYDQGRTTTHEVGHYLGLYHTFDGGCASQSGCYTNGDLICDTNPESDPNFSGCSRSTCGSSDPVKNYMDYSGDLCMDNFTLDQARRMRCTLESWRPDLSGTSTPSPPGQASNPSPTNGATGVSTSASLSWSAGSGADSYDVYFEGAFQGNQTGTSFDPGTLADGTTYSWRVDSVNAVDTTTGSAWSFTTDSGTPGGALFSDGFESGGFSAGGWSTSGGASVKGSAANTGSSGAELRRVASMEVAVDTTGFSDIQVGYARRTSGFDAGESLVVDWYDGSSWTQLESTSSGSWASQSWSLPSGAANNPAFRIRFRTNANRNNERAFVDDVEVTGL